jgi:hypothetical protein
LNTNNAVQYVGCAAIDGLEKKGGGGGAYKVLTLATDQTFKFREVQLKSELSVYLWTAAVH